MPARLTLPKTSAHIHVSNSPTPTHAMAILTHRNAGYEPADRDGAENATHMSRPVLSHELIDERAESVEQEVLDHHLEDEDLGRVRLERITANTQLASHPPAPPHQKTGYSQNIQPPTRTRHTRPKAHGPIAKTAQHHILRLLLIQRPTKHKPPDRKHSRREQTHGNAELGFVDAAVLLGEVTRGEVADGAGRDAQDAADQGAREEEAVFADCEEVRGWGEDLGERVGYAYEEGLGREPAVSLCQGDWEDGGLTMRTAETIMIQTTAGLSRCTKISYRSLKTLSWLYVPEVMRKSCTKVRLGIGEDVMLLARPSSDAVAVPSGFSAVVDPVLGGAKVATSLLRNCDSGMKKKVPRAPKICIGRSITNKFLAPRCWKPVPAMMATKEDRQARVSTSSAVRRPR